jgi:hypothetical protein
MVRNLRIALPSWAPLFEEGDVIVGPQHRAAIGTLVERQTRWIKLIHLPRPDSLQLRDALLREPSDLPVALQHVFYLSAQTSMIRPGPNRDYYLKSVSTCGRPSA